MSVQSEQKAWEKEERRQEKEERKRLKAEQELGQQADQTELQPEAPGTYYGELSPEGQWFWKGTGEPDDRWVANPEHVSADQPELRAAPTPGTAIASTATIDSLFTLVYGTRSADLAATPTYSWATGNMIIGQWPAVTTGQPALFCRFEARPIAPSTIVQ